MRTKNSICLDTDQTRKLSYPETQRMPAWWAISQAAVLVDGLGQWCGATWSARSAEQRARRIETGPAGPRRTRTKVSREFAARPERHFNPPSVIDGVVPRPEASCIARHRRSNPLSH